MKYLLLICMGMALGCSNEKSDDSLPIDNSKLEGVWELEATKISPGGPVEWTDATRKTYYAFNADATFTYEVTENSDYNKSGTYELSESVLHLNFSFEGQEYNDQYYIQLQNGKLILQFSRCIEECKERYIRK